MSALISGSGPGHESLIVGESPGLVAWSTTLTHYLRQKLRAGAHNFRISMVKLKKIRSYMTEFEAEQGKNLLAASGIEAFVEGANTQTALSFVGVAIGGVKLFVDEADRQRAAEVLDAETVASTGPWTCTTCFSEVDEGFDVCWKCGDSRPEAASEMAPESEPQAPRRK